MQHDMSAAEQLEMFTQPQISGGVGTDKHGRVRRLGIVVSIVIVVAVVAIIGVTTLVGKLTDHSPMGRSGWDASQQSHPATTLLTRGATSEQLVPASVSAVANWWDTCQLDACYNVRLGHYPSVIPIGIMKLKDRCLTFTSATRDDHVMVAATASTKYTVSLNSHGDLKVCSAANQGRGDKLVAWNGQP